MTPCQKRWIEDATYQDMLHHIRSAPPGDAMFVRDTEVANYFDVAFKRKREEVGLEGHVAASKAIDW